RDSWVCITIKDCGRGMEKNELDKVFDPFYTTKPRGEGSGLGLSVAHGVIKQHKGIIQIESEKNMGTEVHVYIPMETGVRIEGTASSDVLHKGTVLIAEDTELLKKMLNTILTDLGYDILLASDGEEAIRVFRQNADKIQVVLLDMVMPKKTGREVYEILAPEAEHAKFLLSSGYTTDRDIIAFAKTNRIELIPKPYDPDELARKIQALVNQPN
ncbi:MAG: response regulator, partial [Bacteroidetes bacterium]|nr:response regulator [Bacteroidota bacterium]